MKKYIKSIIKAIVIIAFFVLIYNLLVFMNNQDKNTYNKCTLEHSQNYCIKAIYGIY